MSSEVEKIDWTIKTKDIDFPTFCKILNQEANTEVELETAKQHYNENQRYTIRTAISKAISSIKVQAYEADLEEWRGVALGTRDFTWRDQDPDKLKQIWITFITEDGRLEELKCWGTHINNQKIPFGTLLELKGSWNEYTKPDTKQVYRNWMPKQLKILKELTRQERIELVQKHWIGVNKLSRNTLYQTIVGFGEIGRVVSVTRFSNGVKDGSYELLQRRRDGSDTFTFSVVLQLQGSYVITIDFDPQQLASFYFDLLDFDAIVDASLQTDNQIRELSNALRGRKIFYIGNLSSYKEGFSKTKESRIFIRIRGTALIEADQYPEGYQSTKPEEQLPPKEEVDTSQAKEIEYYKRVVPIMKAIIAINPKEGASIAELATKLSVTEDQMTEMLKEPINTGDIYKPGAGRFKLLGSEADITSYEEAIAKAELGKSKDGEEEEEEEEEPSTPLDLTTAIIQRLMSQPKKWFELSELKDLTMNSNELEQALTNLKNDTTIAKAKDKLKYRLKISVQEAQKMVGTQPSQKPTTKKSEYTQDVIKTIKDAINTLGKNTTAEAIKESGLIDDTIPIEVINVILTDMRK